MASDHEKRRRHEAVIARARQVLNDPGFAVRQASMSAQEGERCRDSMQASRQRRAVVAGVEVEREVGRLEVLTARLLRADAVRRTEMIDGIVKGNLSRWPSLQPSWKKR